MCEQAFSLMEKKKKIKNPYWLRLIELDHLHRVLRVSASNINVKIEKMLNNIQQEKHIKAYF